MDWFTGLVYQVIGMKKEMCVPTLNTIDATMQLSYNIPGCFYITERKTGIKKILFGTKK